MSRQTLSYSMLCLLANALALAIFPPAALAAHEQAFPFNVANGSNPQGGLVADPAGNLYGTTCKGGTALGGTVYEMSPPVPPGTNWTETVLYSFETNTRLDGFCPVGNLVLDGAGNLYGTNSAGGFLDWGTAFELSPPSQPGGAWTETLLCHFGLDCDGNTPLAGLVIDKLGNLYGTALGGEFGAGLIYELSYVDGNWFQFVLYTFTNSANDGGMPKSPLVFDSRGNLYGTTSTSGLYNGGVAFELSPPAAPGGFWTITALHDFGATSTDGAQPLAGLTLGPNGTLVGTTSRGGTFDSGTIFGLVPPSSAGANWGYGVLYSFAGGDGAFPAAGLAFAAPGLLFGTTSSGGTSGNGTVFQLSKAAGGKLTETALYSFTGGKDGGAPLADLLLHNGALYGTTANGGYKNNGVAFRLRH
jgi:uncharacterized repeat protein (TIGR03803 family)